MALFYREYSSKLTDILDTQEHVIHFQAKNCSTCFIRRLQKTKPLAKCVAFSSCIQLRHVMN